ncbi:MAG: glycoside hydrolase family 2, partial [Clostridia bacterium]|nr:glycoside hydrolase family 2 [Clostridia bacterium]
YNYILDTVLPTVGIKKWLCRPASKVRKKVFLSDSKSTIDVLYNHPSVVYYTIFNEGWGQHCSTEIYRILKANDNTRVWDTASGWFKGFESDVQSEHVYFKPVNLKGEKGRPMVLSEFGGYSYKINDNSYNLDKTYGYKTCKNKEEFTSDLEKLYIDEIVPMIEMGLNATVLTQVSDVEDETNGILTYDRKIVKPDSYRMKNISHNLYKAFEKSLVN